MDDAISQHQISLIIHYSSNTLSWTISNGTKDQNHYSLLIMIKITGLSKRRMLAEDSENIQNSILYSHALQSIYGFEDRKSFPFNNFKDYSEKFSLS